MPSQATRPPLVGMPAVWLRDNCPCPLCVRETNYGRLFDVRVESWPSNLAFTSLPIPPHTNNPVTFGYRDATTELSATRPLISLDGCGRIREIRVNPRSLQPVRLPGPRAFYAAYAAYAAFAALLPPRRRC